MKRFRFGRRLLALAGLPLWSACAGESVEPPVRTGDHELYWALDLNHHAVTLALTPRYDTVMLAVTARNYAGEPLAAAGTVTYTSRDIEHVVVAPDGLVRALAVLPPGRLVPVVATMTIGALRHTDSVMIKVVQDTTPALATFTVRPPPPDSAKLAMTVSAAVVGMAPTIADTLAPRATDRDGDPIHDLLVSYRSSDLRVATVDPISGEIIGRRPGVTTIYAGTTVFGVARADTFPYRIGYPLVGLVPVYPDSAGPNVVHLPELVVGAGAIVVWLGEAADTGDAPVNLTFADPTNVVSVDASPNRVRFEGLLGINSPCVYRDGCTTSGDVILRPVTDTLLLFGTPLVCGCGFGKVARVFPIPGVYEFETTAPPFEGRIRVMDERQ